MCVPTETLLQARSLGSHLQTLRAWDVFRTLTMQGDEQNLRVVWSPSQSRRNARAHVHPSRSTAARDTPFSGFPPVVARIIAGFAMIHCEKQLWSILVVAPISMQMKTFKFPALVAFLCALLSLALETAAPHSSFVKELVQQDSKVFNSFTGLLALLLVFRTSQATGRFWESVSLVHGMQGDWIDATATLFSLLTCSKAGAEKVPQNSAAGLSIGELAAMILEELESKEDHAFDLHKVDLLDAHGIDQGSLQALRESVQPTRDGLLVAPELPGGPDRHKDAEISAARWHTRLFQERR